MECKDHMSHDLFGSMSYRKIIRGIIYHAYFIQSLKRNHDELISFKITPIEQTISPLQNCFHTKWKRIMERENSSWNEFAAMTFIRKSNIPINELTIFIL